MVDRATEHWADDQFDEAAAAGARALAEDPRAIAVDYDAASGRIVINLSTGCTLYVPARLIEDLHDATDAQLAAVKPLGAGFALEWEERDVQVNVWALMQGVFGTRRYMAELARRGGARTSPAKVAAARANGAKGGRPRKAVAQ